MKNAAKKTIVQEKGKNWCPSQTIAEPLSSKHFKNMPSGTPNSRSKGRVTKRRGGGSKGKKLFSMLCSITREVLNDLLLRAFRRIVLGCPRLRSKPSQTKNTNSLSFSLIQALNVRHFFEVCNLCQFIYISLQTFLIFHMSTLSAVFNSLLQGNTCCKISIDIEISFNVLGFFRI